MLTGLTYDVSSILYKPLIYKAKNAWYLEPPTPLHVALVRSFFSSRMKEKSHIVFASMPCFSNTSRDAFFYGTRGINLFFITYLFVLNGWGAGERGFGALAERTNTLTWFPHALKLLTSMMNKSSSSKWITKFKYILSWIFFFSLVLSFIRQERIENHFSVFNPRLDSDSPQFETAPIFKIGRQFFFSAKLFFLFFISMCYARLASGKFFSSKFRSTLRLFNFF